MSLTETVGPGMLVSLTYRIRERGGDLVEPSDLPVGYIYDGESELIGGMDHSLLGKTAGDVVELTLEPHQAFGAHDPSLTFTDEIANVPPQFRLLGAEVPMQSETGELETFYVTRIENGRLAVDGNHPLAGKALDFRVQIHEVRKATSDDIVRLKSREPGSTPLN